MKKITTILVAGALLLAGTAAHAQILSGLASGLSSSSVGNLINSVAGVVYSAPVSLNGTYTYDGIAIGVGSSEGGLVSNLAGSAVTSGLETKADEQLSKLGLRKGSFTITFNSSDETFTCNILGVPLSGKYKVGGSEKTVTLTFGKNINYLSMTGNLESGLNSCRMVFQADKLLTLLKKVASIAGTSSSGIGSLTKLADGYDQFKIGFKLKK